MPCSRCGEPVGWSYNVHWKSLGKLKDGDWDTVRQMKGFPDDAFSTTVGTDTWVALCDQCFHFGGGWRRSMGILAAERDAERDAEYPEPSAAEQEETRAAWERYSATREDPMAAWYKNFGAPGLRITVRKFGASSRKRGCQPHECNGPT